MKFYVKDIPEPYPIWEWIKEHTNVIQLSKTIKPSADATRLLNLKHEFNIDKLATIVLGMLDTYGYKGWIHSLGEDKGYGGLSLAINPDYKENCDLNQQTLGTEKNNVKEFFWARTDKFESIKNTYFDTYAFRQPSPCVIETSFNDFIKSFKRSAVRSRIAVINSQYISPAQRKNFGWHKDEIVFENLRINIPIKTDETFLFELLNRPPTHLKYGNVYSWDTNIAHRVFPTTSDVRNRIHIVLGFSPWFDYNAEEDSWTTNEFYGEMHPLDMLLNGHVHENITGLK